MSWLTRNFRHPPARRVAWSAWVMTLLIISGVAAWIGRRASNRNNGSVRDGRRIGETLGMAGVLFVREFDLGLKMRQKRS